MHQTTRLWPATEAEIVHEWPAPAAVFKVQFPAGTLFSEVEEFLQLMEWAVTEARIWGGWVR